MLTRALIVLLVVLNLGVALWWIARPDPAPSALPPQPQGVARLQLATEVPAAPAPAAAMPPAAAQVAAAATTPPAAPAAAPVVAEPPAQCFRLGPFANAAAAQAAIAALGARAQRGRTHQATAGKATGYNVFLPPLPDRAAAQAVAQRIAAAGLDDFFVVNEGEQANAIALGRYRNREGAERRLAALKAAGFDAQLAETGAPAAQWWADIAAAPGVDAPQARAAASARESQPLDCAALG